MRKQGSRRSEVSSSSEKVRLSHLIIQTPGINCYVNVTYWKNTLISLTRYLMVSTLEYEESTRQQLPTTAQPFSIIQMPINKSLKENSNAADTLARALVMRLKPSSGPSSHRHFLWFLSQENPDDFALYITFHIHAFLLPNSPRLTIQSTLICSPVPGAPFSLYVTQFTIYLRVHRHLFETWQRRTGPSPSPTVNGQDSWSNYEKTSPSQSTHVTTLASHQPEAFTANSGTLPRTFSERVGLVHCRNGSMITYSFAFVVSTFHLTMPSGQSGERLSKKTAVVFSQGAGTGTEVKKCQTAYQQNLTRTLLVPFWIILTLQFVPQSILLLHTAMPTLIIYQKSSAFHGKNQKPSPFAIPYLTWGLNGTCRLALSQSRRARKRNTKRLLKNGYRSRLTPWTKHKSFTESYFTYLSSFQPDARTLPTWKPCWGHSTQVLSCPTTHLEIQPKISPGGSTSSTTPKSLGASLVHALLQTEVRSQMPVQASESESLSLEDGALGALSLDGRKKGGTSDGQKLWASNFLYALSSRSAPQESTSKSLATTEEWSKAGGKGEVETKKQTLSSGEYTTSQLLTNALLSHVTCPAKKTQRTVPHEAYTPPHPCYYQPFTSPKVSNSSSSTSTANLFPVSVISKLSEIPSSQSQNPIGARPTITQKMTSAMSTIRNGSEVKKPSNRMRPNVKTTRNLPIIPQITSTARPAAYSPHLTPNPSILRPHCLARERLRLWKPFNSHINRRHDRLLEEDIKRIFDVMANAWSQSTHEAYSSGLLVWHVHCDKKLVPESMRAPAHHSYIASFVASLAGSYSGSTIANYLYGLRAWHLLHSVEWKMNTLEMEALLKGAARLAPDSSKRKTRQPYTPEFITKVGEQLNLSLPLDASVYSCLTIGFYSVARVGELTIPRLNAFDPAKHITPANLRTETNQNGMGVTVLHIPHTKAAPLEGEDVYWSRQHGPTDPYEALANHRRINDPMVNDHLFAYIHKGRLRPLTKHAFIKRVAEAAQAAGLEPLQGHGIRIGATLLYLLRGVPFEAVKVMGRWSSDTFLRYLRKHAQILTPYIQADPDLHRTFSHFTMPSQAMFQGRQ